MTARTPSGDRTLRSIVVVPALLVLTVAVALLGVVATGAAAPNSLVPAAGLVTWGVPAARALQPRAPAPNWTSGRSRSARTWAACSSPSRSSPGSPP